MVAIEPTSTQSFAGCSRACRNPAIFGLKAERKLWLDLLAGSFKLIYKDGDDDTPNIPIRGSKPAEK